MLPTTGLQTGIFIPIPCCRPYHPGNRKCCRTKTVDTDGCKRRTCATGQLPDKQHNFLFRACRRKLSADHSEDDHRFSNNIIKYKYYNYYRSRVTFPYWITLLFRLWCVLATPGIYPALTGCPGLPSQPHDYHMDRIVHPDKRSDPSGHRS